MWSKFMLLTAATANAGQDLFNTDWTQGNLYEISWLTDKLGTFSCWVISVVGFGIVIFSILKNAFSGLYVVSPDFWDRVDEVKRQAVDGVSSGITDATGRTGNAAVQRMGGILVFMLSLIPNVKSLTDFDDGAPVDKKQYFMRSIPLLVAQIFIGMLIFFGYPAKIADWIGTGATHAVSAVINNIDPVTVVTGISDKFTVYNLSTDGSQDPFEQNINKMTSEMISVMATRYNDMDKSNVQNIAYVLEQNLLSAFDSEGAKRSLGTDQGYVISITTNIQSNTPSVSSSYGDLGNGVKMAQATNGTISFRYWIQSSSILTSEHTTKLGADDFMVWSVTATPVAIANISTANLIVFGGISEVPTVANNTFSLSVQHITVGDGANDLKGSLGKVVTVSAMKDGAVQKTFNATLQTASITQQSAAQPILTFSSSDREALSTALGNSNYLKISLVGDWSKTVTNTTTGSTTSLRVTELRLMKNASGASYAISTWTDVTEKTTKGVATLSESVIKQSSMKTNK